MLELPWKDSFDLLGKAIHRLKEVMIHPKPTQIDYLIDATIQRFEFTIELFWKALKKILFYEKIESTTPRDTLNKAYQYYLIDDEALWLKMMDDRNNTSHAYKESEAARIFLNIQNYLPIFEKTYQKLKEKYQL